MLRLSLLIMAFTSLACAPIARLTVPDEGAASSDRRAAYEKLRQLDDDHAVAGDSSRLLDIVPAESLTGIEAQRAADAKRSANLFLASGVATIATSWTAGLAGVGTSIVLVSTGQPKDYAMSLSLGVGATGVAIAGSAIGTALLVPGALSWAEAIDHDVAAYSTYDDDLRTALRIDEEKDRLAALPMQLR